MIMGKFGYFLFAWYPPVIVKLRDFCREKLRTEYFICTVRRSTLEYEALLLRTEGKRKRRIVL